MTETVHDILDRVGYDAEAAAEALSVERSSDAPRSTLVDALEARASYGTARFVHSVTGAEMAVPISDEGEVWRYDTHPNWEQMS